MRTARLALAASLTALTCRSSTAPQGPDDALRRGPSIESPALRLPRFVGDHMVLQRERDVRVWGWSASGSSVEVAPSWTQDVARTHARADGRWIASVRTPAAGGPFTIDVRSNGETKRIEDVLVGEVWLGAGQSNMEMWVGDVPGGFGGVKDWQREVATANLPRLRLFNVENRISARAEEDVEGAWKAATPDTVARFSATAFFFGQRLHAELGVPIGLVTADWGGTPAEAWMTEEAIERHGGFADALARVKREREHPGEGAAAALRAQDAWWKALDAREPVSALAKTKAVDWREQPVPGLWDKELARFDGVAWCRRFVTLPKEWEGRELLLDLGAIDDMDTVFVDGVAVGRTHAMGHWSEPRHYVVPATLTQRSFPQLELALRIVDTGGGGGTTGDARSFELRPRHVVSGQGLALGGTWELRPGAAMSALGAFPSAEALSPSMPSTLFHGMLDPLRAGSFAGVIWYQGEANVGRAQQYRTLFPALIADWRTAFRAPELPFLFVQIAPFRYDGDRGEAARQREAQLAALALPHTGVAVTMDAGEKTDIHPKDKQTVGERLARCALRRVYGREEIVDRGPSFRAITIDGGAVRVHLDDADGLELRATKDALFELAGADRKFHPASARVDGSALVVSSPDVKAPVAVRYAFRADDLGALFNSAGLPASSFRSDDWDQ